MASDNLTRLLLEVEDAAREVMRLVPNESFGEGAYSDQLHRLRAALSIAAGVMQMEEIEVGRCAACGHMRAVHGRDLLPRSSDDSERCSGRGMVRAGAFRGCLCLFFVERTPDAVAAAMGRAIAMPTVDGPEWSADVMARAAEVRWFVDQLTDLINSTGWREASAANPEENHGKEERSDG